jgi:hypothetical protein
MLMLIIMSLIMHVVALLESEVTDLIREDFPFFMCTEASIIQFNSPALVLNFTAHTRDFICPQI